MTDAPANGPRQRGRLRPKRVTLPCFFPHTLCWKTLVTPPSKHTQNRPTSHHLHLHQPGPSRALGIAHPNSAPRGKSRSRMQTQAPWRRIRVPYGFPAPQPGRPRSAARLPSAQSFLWLLAHSEQSPSPHRVTTRPHRICAHLPPSLLAHCAPATAACCCSFHTPGRLLPQSLCTWNSLPGIPFRETPPSCPPNVCSNVTFPMRPPGSCGLKGAASHPSSLIHRLHP